MKPVDADNEPAWKVRFRVPVIRRAQVAASAPERGLITSNVSGTFQLHVWEVPSGRLRMLTNRRTGITAGLLSPDGRSVYYHDDTGGNELGHFVRIPFEGGAPVSITPNMSPYPTFGLAVSGEGNRLGFITADGNGYHLHVFEVGGARLHPSGTYGDAYFARDGSIRVVWEDSTHPPQVIALHPATGRPTGTLLPPLNIPQCRPWRSVSFASTDQQQIQGWLAVPDGAGPFPTILHVHGGPEAVMTEMFFPGSQSWLDHGFAFLSINYRGSTTFGRAFLEQIWGNLGRWEVEDMVAARKWLVTEGIADPARVFVAGGSYGGYLTLQALGTRPDLWAGGMAGMAVADWAVAHEDTTDTLRGWRAATFGGTPEEVPERYAASSPITYAQQVKAPVMIIQGRNDTRTPPRSVQVYEAKMKALGKTIEVHWFDAGHGSLVVDQAIAHHELMLRFAQRVLSTSAS